MYKVCGLFCENAEIILYGIPLHAQSVAVLCLVGFRNEVLKVRAVVLSQRRAWTVSPIPHPTRLEWGPGFNV